MIIDKRKIYEVVITEAHSVALRPEGSSQEYRKWLNAKKVSYSSLLIGDTCWGYCDWTTHGVIYGELIVYST